MPKAAICSAILAVGLAGGAAAHAAATKTALVSAARLYDVCTSEQYYSQGSCRGYVAGVADVVIALGGRATGACMPANVSVDRLQEVVTRSLKGAAKAAHLSAADAVARALARAYPCRRR